MTSNTMTQHLACDKANQAEHILSLPEVFREQRGLGHVWRALKLLINDNQGHMRTAKSILKFLREKSGSNERTA